MLFVIWIRAFFKLFSCPKRNYSTQKNPLSKTIDNKLKKGLKTHLMNNSLWMDLDLKRLCLTKKGLVYTSSLFRIYWKTNLKKDKKTLKLSFLVVNISKYTTIKEILCKIQENEGFLGLIK